MCAVSARLRVKFFYVTASCKMLRVYDISLQVGTLQAIAAEDLRIQVRCGSGVEFRLIGAADHLVLCARRHMVRQQFDLFQLFRIQQPARAVASKFPSESLTPGITGMRMRNGFPLFLSRSRFSRIGPLDTPV